MRTAFEPSELSSPHDSYAILTAGSRPPNSSASGPTVTNLRSPTGSPSRHAPVAAGLPATERIRDSVTISDGTESADVCQSMVPPLSRVYCLKTHEAGSVCYAPRLSCGSLCRVRRRCCGCSRGEPRVEVGENVVDALEADR